VAARAALTGAAPLLALLLTLIGGCGGEEALQLVQGTLTQPALQVRAFSGGHPSGTAPVTEGGRFTLALAPGVHTFTVVRAGTAPLALGPAEGLEICQVGDPVELGPVVVGPPACPPAPECPDAQLQLDACLQAELPLCEDLGRQVDLCRRQRDADCAPLAEALSACMSLQPACPAEADALDACLAGHPCVALQERFFDQCVPQPCAPIQVRVDQLCAPQTPCEAGEVALPAQWPRAVGCEARP
jgi:hypothetical protein